MIARHTSSATGRTLAVGVLVLLASGAVLGAFRPGYMSADSFVQLAQARSGNFDDWHPPVMAALWSLVDRLYPGPGGMLALHSVMFFTGLGLLLARAGDFRFWVALPFFAIAALPPIFGVLNTVWKDVGMAAALLCATAQLDAASSAFGRARTALLLGALVALGYAGAMRHNAAPAALPLCVWWVALTSQKVSGSRWRAMAAGVALTGALVLLTNLTNSLLTHGETRFPGQQVAIYDLSAISLEVGAQEPELEALLRPGKGPLDVASHYAPEHAWSLIFLDDSPFLPATEAAQSRGLWRGWARAIAQHPMAYLRHRWRVVRHQFGLADASCSPFHPGIDSNSLGIAVQESSANRFAMKLLTVSRDSLLFRPWFYVVLSVAALALNLRRKQSARVTVLLASGIAYALPYTVLSIGCDFRFLWWTCVACCVGFALKLTRRSFSVRQFLGGRPASEQARE